jgi:uncharacterized protein YoxC
VESFLLVMEILALGCVSVLCIYLITVLVRMRSVLTEAEKNLKELSVHALPVLENLEVITDRVKSVTERIDGQIESVVHSINAIKEVADNIVNFERRVQDRIEEPVLETVSVLGAVFRGVRTFVDRLRS